MRGMVAAAALMATGAAAHAEIALSGDFKATQACPAVQSIRKGTNPGEVSLQAGHSYPLIAKNKEEATHFLVAIEGADPRERWVAVGCGEVAGASSGPAPGAAAATPVPAPRVAHGEATHVLALGWEPEFCEERGEKAECQRETEQSFDATHFSLHGLWPQPIGNFYCGVDQSLKQADKRSRWFELPEPDISANVRARLADVMPGILSGLERHEWIKHGTCFHADANTYFSREIGLIGEVNGSAAQRLFAQRIGKTVTAQEIRTAFDQSFGAGAGERVEVHCQGDGEEREISEIFIYLSGEVNGAAPLADLIHAAPPAEARCQSGKVAEPSR